MENINGTKRSIYNLFKKINYLCIIIYFIWYITPVFRGYFYGGFYNLTIVGLLGIWLATAIILNPSWALKWNIHLIVVTIQIIAFIILALLDIGGNALSHMSLAISFWFTLYVYHFYASMGWHKTIGKIGVILLIILSITTITTLIGLINIPNASRLLTASSSSSMDALLYSNNIGGFDFIYGLIILIPTIIGFLIQKNKAKGYVKWFFITFIILSLFVVLNSSFTIAIFAMIVAVVLGFLSKFRYRNSLLLILIISFLFLLIPKDTMGIYFIQTAQRVDNSFISDRLQSVGYYLNGVSNSSQHLSNRLITYETSFDTFLDNPLGVGTYYYEKGVGVGNHSQILDDLARYGIFGLAYYLLFFYLFYKYVKRQWFIQKFKANFLSSLVTFLFISLLNPTFSSQSISIILFFLLPALPCIIKYLNKDIKSDYHTQNKDLVKLT